LIFRLLGIPTFAPLIPTFAPLIPTFAPLIPTLAIRVSFGKTRRFFSSAAENSHPP
jgi:hypothetical protein